MCIRDRGDSAARDRLIEHNLRLVAHIAKKYYSVTNEQDDLISIGTIGLIKAVGTFDYTKDVYKRQVWRSSSITSSNPWGIFLRAWARVLLEETSLHTSTSR